ncbi:SIT4 phosphatase-associated protein family [Sesbania bispinosa]|nr:SIT4 phosphatase-associated protein family [Sesbania bispinosa]
MDIDTGMVHQEIVKKLVELIGITSIMEGTAPNAPLGQSFLLTLMLDNDRRKSATLIDLIFSGSVDNPPTETLKPKKTLGIWGNVLIRLIGADEHMYVNNVDAMQWIEHTDVLEMIVDKFSSSDSPEVHANAAETLCAITRFAPAGLSAKISSPSFIGRLFRHALEDSRPKSVLVNSLSVCISLLDPKRLAFGAYNIYNRQMTNGSTVTANPETVEGMLESLGDLLKLLGVSSAENLLLTTFGKLQPPLGKHRLKEHLLRDCDFVGKIIQAEKHFTLEADTSKPTAPAEGKSPPRIGSIGHLTRISNKLIQLGNNNSVIQQHLQGNNEWTDWYMNILSNRNAVENVYQWACGEAIIIWIVGFMVRATAIFQQCLDFTVAVSGSVNLLIVCGRNILSQAFWRIYYVVSIVMSSRPKLTMSSTQDRADLDEELFMLADLRPTALHDRTRDSDEDDFQDRDYDVAALANNLCQASRYGIYNNEDMEEVHGSLERDDEDVYFDDESAEVVISSLRLGDDHESGSLFTNSNWFAFEEDRDRVANERSTGSIASPSPNAEEGANNSSGDDNVTAGEDEDLADTATSSPQVGSKLEHCGTDKPVEWVEWRESSDATDPSDVLPNGELETKLGNNDPDTAVSSSPSSSVALIKQEQVAAEPSASHNKNPSIETSESTQTGIENPSSCAPTSVDEALTSVGGETVTRTQQTSKKESSI